MLVGSGTYGKGSAQSVFQVVGGGGLKLTTARWFTPSGRSISKRSRASQLEVEGDEARLEREFGDSTRFRTDRGRPVRGGGGIAPDVSAGDTLSSSEELELQRALGNKLPRFRDAISDYAAELRSRRALTRPDFSVTPQMRDELFRRLSVQGLAVTRATFDAAHPVVDLLLGNEATRYSFGAEAEFRRRVTTDPIMRRALALLRGARTPDELLGRVKTVLSDASTPAESPQPK